MLIEVWNLTGLRIGENWIVINFQKKKSPIDAHVIFGI